MMMAQESTKLTVELASYRNPDRKPFICRVPLTDTADSDSILAWICDSERPGRFSYNFIHHRSGHRTVAINMMIDDPTTAFEFKMRWANGQ